MRPHIKRLVLLTGTATALGLAVLALLPGPAQVPVAESEAWTPTAEPGPAASMAVADAAPRRVAAPAAPAPAELMAEAPGAVIGTEGRLVRGLVVDADGEPLAGAAVSAVLWREGEQLDPWTAVHHGLSGQAAASEPVFETVAESDGSFLAQVPPPPASERAAVLHVQAEHDEGRGAVRLRVDRGEAPLAVRIAVAAQRWVQGIVLQPNGAPCADAIVSAMPDAQQSHDDVQHLAQRATTVRTGSDGRFRLAAPRQAPLLVAASREGHAVEVRRVDAPGDQELELRLQGTGSLSGRVRDAQSGAPIAGAAVSLLAGGLGGAQTGAVRTDADGRFRLLGLSLDKQAQLVVRHPDYAPVSTHSDPDLRVQLGQALRAGLADHHLEVAMSAGPRFAARLLRPDGSPAAGCRMTLHGPARLASRAARADAQGWVELRGLAEGPHQAEIDDADLVLPDAFRIVHVRRVAAAGADGDVPTIVLERSFAVAVRVTDGARQPIASVAVDVAALQYGHVVANGRAETDGEGRAQVAGLPSSLPLHLRIDEPKFALFDQTFEPVDDATVGRGDRDLGVAVLQRCAAAAGLLTDAAGRPLPGAKIHAFAVGSSQVSAQTTTDAAGAFAFPRLPHGDLRLVAEATGQALVEVAVTQVQPGELRGGLHIVTQSGATVAGVVVDERDAPVPFALVTALRPAHGLAREVRSAFQRAVTECDERGAFELHGLPDEGALFAQAVSTAAGVGRGLLQLEDGRELRIVVRPPN
ncbi:MAG: carboxypeptidase-like regulatory domain-containing protein [Planctomycetota bacterium]